VPDAAAADADFNGDGRRARWRRRWPRKRRQFDTVDTAADDTCLIAFTSGTTGVPKGTMHFHRDVIAACRCWPPHVLRAHAADDVFIGSPPLAFTFGLGGLLMFPLVASAPARCCWKRPRPTRCCGHRRYRATVCFTAPTSYRAMAAQAPPQHDLSLAAQVRVGRRGAARGHAALWKQATGIELIDGIGSTELFHIFISADEAHARPGATGLPVPGYRGLRARRQGRELPRGQVGRLAVKGPTGCKYLADERQATTCRAAGT
jgi:2-aminobenzoate-CoA ligase